jgi:hypothetical protein
MRGLALALLAFVLVCGPSVAAPPPAQELQHSPLVPQGFPYAAEVRFEIHGKVHYEYHNTVTSPNVCDTQSSVQNENVDINVDWRVAYNQVTVPVADDKELGAAAKRLRLRVTPTSDGVDQGSSGTYDVNGFGPSSDGRCDKVNYGQQGTLTIAGRPSYTDMSIDTTDPFTSRQVFFFTMLQVAAANPPTYRDEYGANTKIEPWIYLSDIPSAKDNMLLQKADWDTVGVEYTPQFRALRTNALVQLKPIARQGSVPMPDCTTSSVAGEPSQICTASFSSTYTITVKRHFLYLTKREYPR